MSKKNININIAGIPISIDIEEQIEGYIRNGAKMINDEVRMLSEKKSEREKGFFLAYVALKIAASYVHLEEGLKRIDDISNRMDSITEKHK